MQQAKFLKAASAGAAMILLCLSQAASAIEISPYFQSWGGSMVDAKQAANLTNTTLGFAVTRGTCAWDAGFAAKIADARNYVSAGGQLRISFGGADGTYAEIACKDDNQLFSMIEKLMVDTGTRRLDFDVEGNQLLDTQGTARRTRVLARLQAKYPDMYLSFTLPIWLRGLDNNSINLLNTTKAAGVRVDMVNMMTMSFGAQNIKTMVVPATVGQATIMGYQAAVSQMAAIYPTKTQTQLNAMMGVTPMIGKNDDGTVFTLADAQTVANFAKQNGMGFIGYWAFQRDRAQSSSSATDLNTYSGVAQSNYQFYNIFKSAVGAATPAPVPAPVVPPPYVAPAPVNPAPACSSTAWVQGKQYAVGSIVSYPNGKLYIAKVANPGYDPVVSTYFWSQYICGGSAVVAAPVATPTVTPTPVAVCGSSAWVQGKDYAIGSIVSYTNGKLYIARVANPGYDPVVSTYFWSLYTC